MKIISTSYSNTPEYQDPVAWLGRISFYTGLLEQLARRHQVASIERISYEGYIKQGGVDYFFIDLKKKVSRLPFRIHACIRQYHPDLVLVNGFVFPLQIIQLRMTMGKKVTILVLHRAERPARGWKKWLQRIADRCVDGYLFSSFQLAQEWLEGGHIARPNKIHQVMQASSRFHYRAEKRNPAARQKPPVFLWVGRLEKNKDPLTVIKAFFALLLHEPQARLYLIYSSQELIAEVEALVGGSENIVLLGTMPHEELEAWYHEADFIVSGSHHEGGGTAISEAMSCGCIPVLTDIPSFRAITNEGSCGFLYPPGNAEALCHALIAALAGNRDEMRLKVLEQFWNELSFEALARKIDGVAEKLQKN